MPRLTNDQRLGIRNAVLADMPPRVDHQEAIRKRIKELNLTRLPLAIQRIAGDSKLNGYLATGSVYIDNGGSFAIYIERDNHWGRRDNEFYTADETVKELVQEMQDQRNARANADTALRRDLDLCTTDAIFRERFPELAKYLPVTTKELVATLPATTATLDALKEAGWPKEKADS